MDKLRTYTDIITFGKFKGKTVEEVLTLQPTYLSWLEDETDKTDLTEELKIDISESSYEDDVDLDYWDICHND